MCKARFDSQGIILNDFKKIFEKNAYDFHFLILPLSMLFVLRTQWGEEEGGISIRHIPAH